MKFQTLKLSRAPLVWGAAFLFIFSIFLGIFSYEYVDELEWAALDDGNASVSPIGTVSLTIKVAERVLEVYDNGILLKKYRIAVGKSKSPTPIGEWDVVWKDYNWGTGFGTRWMGLNVPWGIYGIHGTNKPWSIGQFTSHGCIRMRNKDVEQLFEWVPIGTVVRIEDKRKKVERMLKYQMMGSDVAMMQLKLKEKGYLLEKADGLFGLATETAVKKYQQENGLEVTGIVNRAMLEQLGI